MAAYGAPRRSVVFLKGCFPSRARFYSGSNEVQFGGGRAAPGAQTERLVSDRSADLCLSVRQRR